MFYDGINLHNIIKDCKTFEKWSASSRAYELFGAFLDSNIVEVDIDGYDWVKMIYNPNYPTELYLVINKNWSVSDWNKVKAIKSKEVQISSISNTKTELVTSAVTLPDEDELRKEEQDCFLTALAHKEGSLSEASRISRIPLSKYRNWMVTDVLFKESVVEIGNAVKDMVEGALIKEAKFGDVPAIKYFLDARATDRGYGDKSNVVAEETQVLNLDALSLSEQQTLSKLLTKAQPKLLS